MVADANWTRFSTQASESLRRAFLNLSALPLCNWRPLRLPGDDVAAAQPRVFYHLVSQELGQALGCADGCGLLLPIIFQLPRHGTVLRDQLKQLRIRHVSSLEEEAMGKTSCRRKEPPPDSLGLSSRGVLGFSG